MAAATVLLVAANLLVTLGSTLLDASTYLDGLDANQVYDRTPAAVSEQLVRWVESRPTSEPITLGPFETTDLEVIFVALAPPDWLRGQARAVIPAIVDRIEVPRAAPIEVSLRDLKDRIAGGPLLRAVRERIRTWPACGQADLDELLAGNLIRCQPPTAALDLLDPVFTKVLVTVSARLPASIDLAPIVTGATGSPGAVGVVRALRSTPPGLLFAVLLLLLGATLLRGFSWRSLLGTWGAPLLIGGLVVLVLALLADPVGEAAVAGLRASLAAGGLAPGLVAIVGSVVGFVVGRVGQALLTMGGLLTACGVILLVVRSRAIAR